MEKFNPIFDKMTQQTMISSHPYFLKIGYLGFFLFLTGITFSIVVLQAAAVLFLILGVGVLSDKWTRRRFTAFDWLLIFYLFSGVLSIILSPAPSESLTGIIRHGILFALIPIHHLIVRMKRFSLTTVIFLLVVGGTLAAAMGGYHHWRGVERTAGFYGGYYTLATLLTLTIPLTVVFSFLQKKIWRIIMPGAAGIQLVALWWTYTRSAFLGLIIAFMSVAGLIFWQKKNIPILSRLKTVGLLLIIPLVLATLILTSLDPRINPFAPVKSTGGHPADITSGRGSIVQDAVVLLKKQVQDSRWDRILLGHGLRSRVILSDSPFRSWESDYLEVFMNQGLLGLGLVLAIYFLFLKRIVLLLKPEILNSQSLVPGVVISAGAFWVMSFFTLQLQGISSAAIFVVLFTMADALPEQKKQEYFSVQGSFTN
ncbi:MAG: hypothetical protein Kow0042_25680 [Calditrichia bacterium]